MSSKPNTEDMDFVAPDDQGETPKKKRSSGAASRKKSGQTYDADYCQNLLFQLFNFFARITSHNHSKKAKDFAEDGATLSRLSEKYAVIGLIIRILDPFMFIVGQMNHYSGMFVEWRERRKAKKQQQAEQAAGLAVNANDSYAAGYTIQQ